MTCLIVIAAFALAAPALAAVTKPADLEAICNSFTETQCASTADFPFCQYDATAGNCSFISSSCPSDLSAAVANVASCGASSANPCPTACLAPEVQVRVVTMSRAGITSYNKSMDELTLAGTSAQSKQAFADLLYCTSSQSADTLAAYQAVNCSSAITNDMVNQAIAALTTAKSSTSSTEQLIFSGLAFVAVLVVATLG